MRVLNKQERTKAFLWFLLFFVITVGLFVVAVFFNFQVPSRENATLRKELSTFRQEQAFQGEFQDRLNKVLKNLDSVDVPGQNAEYIDRVVIDDLADIRKRIPREAVTHYGLYDNFVQTCLSLQQTHQELRKLSNAQQTIAQQKERIQDLTRENDDLRREMEHYRGLWQNSNAR